MEIKDQVCSYDQALKLEKLGVFAEAYLSFVYFTKTEEENKKIELLPTDTIHIGYATNAYMVSELTVMLPYKITRNLFDFPLKIKKTKTGYRIIYRTVSRGNDILGFELRPIFDNFAHALADMLIWLIENNHVDPKELKL